MPSELTEEELAAVREAVREGVQEGLRPLSESLEALERVMKKATEVADELRRRGRL